jgi:hypothetical protein
LKHNKEFRDAGIEIGKGTLENRMAAIETPSNMIKIKMIQHTLKIKGSKKDMNFIMEMQKIFRLK